MSVAAIPDFVITEFTVSLIILLSAFSHVFSPQNSSSKHWSKYNSVTDIIAYTGYDAYSRQTPEYCKAMNYLNNRTYDNDLYENVITIILPIYNDECDDMSYGATMYYNPKLVTPNWNFAQLEELQIEGLESDEFKAYRYIDDCAE